MKARIAQRISIARERQRPSDSEVHPRATEKHYSPEAIAGMWGIHPSTVRRLFRNRPGVVHLGEGDSNGKREYVTIRIPESVLERFHRGVTK